MKYSVHVRCACTGKDGRPLGQACPQLWRRDGAWNSRHGSAGFACRIPASGGTRLLKRFGYTSKAEAESAAQKQRVRIPVGLVVERKIPNRAIDRGKRLRRGRIT